MKTVWRVDNELLTLREVEYSEKMPIGEWLPVFLGSGEYAYFSTYKEAKDMLASVIDTEIEALVEMRNALTKEK